MINVNDYVSYTRRKKKHIAIVDGFSEIFEGTVYITLLNGETISTHIDNLEKLEMYIIPGDYISVINASLDTGDREWFNDLCNRYINFAGG